MNQTQQIIAILSAIGASPKATTDRNGNTSIRVNAPTVAATKEGGR